MTQNSDISLEKVKILREKSGAGIQICKNALEETKGDIEKAINFLRQKGLISAEKKQSRPTKQGIISSYIHNGSKIGVLLELNCETDFVARRLEFQNLAKNLGMQIVAGNVQYISLKDIPENVWSAEMEIESKREDLKTKPENIRESILKARVEKNMKNLTLLNQAFIREPELTVEDYIKKHISLLGENIQLTRFTKFIIGENN